MEVVDKIPPQPWMTAPETQAVVAALGAEGQAVRFVGGCVRDAVVGRPVNDVDIATPDPPETVIRLLRQAGLKAVPTGIAHGTVTAVAGHRPFEITTLRHDVETDGRWAKVAFTDDWQADAARRDLTMNALSCAPDGTLHDYFGGLADLRAGRVRFVGDPRQRIHEDYLRILRFFRFHAHYGHGAPDAAALAAAAAAAPKLATLSAERIRDEILKLLAAPDPVPVLAVMREARILEAVLPELACLAVLARLLPLEPGPPDALLRLAAALPADGGLGDAVGRRLRLSNHDRRRLATLTGPPIAVHPGLPARELRAACYRLGARPVGDLLRLASARRGDAAGLDAALATLAAWQPTALPIKGRDLIALGLPKGPAVSRLLGEIEAWWLDNDCRPGRDACLAEARRRLGECAPG